MVQRSDWNALSFDGKGSHVDIGTLNGAASSVSFWSRWEASHWDLSFSLCLMTPIWRLNTFGHKNLQVIVRNDLSVTNVHHDNTPELRILENRGLGSCWVSIQKKQPN